MLPSGFYLKYRLDYKGGSPNIKGWNQLFLPWTFYLWRAINFNWQREREKKTHLWSPEAAVLQCCATEVGWRSAGGCCAVHQESWGLPAWWNWLLRTHTHTKRTTEMSWDEVHTWLFVPSPSAVSEKFQAGAENLAVRLTSHVETTEQLSFDICSLLEAPQTLAEIWKITTLSVRQDRCVSCFWFVL